VRYIESRPSPDLAPRVHCIWELEGSGDLLSEPIFPDGRVEIVVHLADRPCLEGSPDRQPDVMIVGQMTRALRLAPVRRLHAVGIRFTPAGARAWLASPLHELTNRVQAVGDVSMSLERHLREAIRHATSPEERVARVEALLRSSGRRRDPVRAVDHAIAATLARAGRVTIDALAHSCGVSPRQLERQYLEAVGLTPKVFARTVRFQQALQHLRGGVPAAATAAECGFADQSHLAREFHRFAGTAARDVNLAHVAFLQDAARTAAAH
jgi:AraC-like DNA-binding protein